MTRAEVSKKVAAYYSKKFGGVVRCEFDSSKRKYEIQGDRLTPAPELASIYVNGWSLLDYIEPSRARAIAEGF